MCGVCKKTEVRCRGPRVALLAGAAGSCERLVGGSKAEMVGRCQTMGGLAYPTESLDFILKTVGGLLQDLSPRVTRRGWYFRKFPKGV